MSRLLLLACSQAKRELAHPTPPAVELYDGPAWRLFRKWRREQHMHMCAGVECYAVSAEHGLIWSGAAIAPYDRKLDRARAFELASQAHHAERLADYLNGYGDPELFVFGGALYADLVTSWIADAAPDYTYRCCCDGARGIGDMLGELRRWLYAA